MQGRCSRSRKKEMSDHFLYLQVHCDMICEASGLVAHGSLGPDITYQYM